MRHSGSRSQGALSPLRGKSRRPSMQVFASSSRPRGHDARLSTWKEPSHSATVALRWSLSIFTTVLTVC